MMKSEICRCCGLEAKHFEYSAIPFTQSCDRCGSYVYVGDMGAPVSELYSETYYTGGEYMDYEGDAPIHSHNFQRKIDIIEKCAGAQAFERVVDVGCAYGFFLDACVKHGTRTHLGLDVGASGVAHCKQKGLNAELLSEEDPLPTQIPFSPTLVTLWDTFEHLMDPAASVKQIASWQGGGGILAMSTVRSDSIVARLRGRKWRQFHPPTHLCYPTKQALSLLVESLGYEVLRHDTFGYARAFEQYLNAVSRSLPKLVGHKFRKVPVVLNLFDIQLIVARKRG